MHQPALCHTQRTTYHQVKPPRIQRGSTRRCEFHKQLTIKRNFFHKMDKTARNSPICALYCDISNDATLGPWASHETNCFGRSALHGFCRCNRPPPIQYEYRTAACLQCSRQRLAYTPAGMPLLFVKPPHNPARHSRTVTRFRNGRHSSRSKPTHLPAG